MMYGGVNSIVSTAEKGKIMTYFVLFETETEKEIELNVHYCSCRDEACEFIAGRLDLANLDYRYQPSDFTIIKGQVLNFITRSGTRVLIDEDTNCSQQSTISAS